MWQPFEPGCHVLTSVCPPGPSITRMVFRQGLPLPSITKGTLMVTDLVGATLEEQRVLLEWLNAPRAVRVITLSEVPLFDFVVAGTLLEQLYYRLNPIYCALDWSCGSGSEAPRRLPERLQSADRVFGVHRWRLFRFHRLAGAAGTGYRTAEDGELHRNDRQPESRHGHALTDQCFQMGNRDRARMRATGRCCRKRVIAVSGTRTREGSSDRLCLGRRTPWVFSALRAKGQTA